MTLKLTKVAHADDFMNLEFKKVVNENDLIITPLHPNAVPSILHRKTWEIVMTMISFEKLAIIHSDAEILGIGVAKEPTISMLSSKVKRVFATDIYLDDGPWWHWYERELLKDARPFMGKNYNHKRVVWQHVDGRDLPYEDNSFDGIFSCSSIEHFGGEKDIRKAIEEIYRVLKPGGVAAISTEYKISGIGPGFANVQLFDKERLQRVWIDGVGWRCIDFIDDELDNTNYIDFERSINDPIYNASASPHIKLDNGTYKWTSVHMTFIK
jgi:SAM-dependent methyltransferase